MTSNGSTFFFFNSIFRFRVFLLCLIVLLFAPFSFAQTKVIGYVPTWVDMRAVIDNVDLDKLTHINISFANPNNNGDFLVDGEPVCMGGASAADINYVVETAHAANVQVLVSVAGGVLPDCSGDWRTFLQEENREEFTNKLLQMSEFFNLDGIDIDLEWAVLTNIDNDGNYTPFIELLSESLSADNKLLTCATASADGGMIPISSIPYFDFVNIMSYDVIGPSWGTAGDEHSSYTNAVNNINVWKSRGLTKEKLVLGVPFYGYGFGSYNSDYTYAQIIADFGTDSASSDVIGNACSGCNYITYNGAATIAQKTELALEEGSGVMIWELSQDASGENSLLSIIDAVVNGETPSIPTAPTPSTSSGGSGSNSSGGTGGSSGGGAIHFLLIALLMSMSLRKRK